MLYYLMALNSSKFLLKKHSEFITTNHSKLFAMTNSFAIINYYNPFKRYRTDYGINQFFMDYKLEDFLKELNKSKLSLIDAYSLAFSFIVYQSTTKHLLGYIASLDERKRHKKFDYLYSPHLRYFEKFLCNYELKLNLDDTPCADYFVKMDLDSDVKDFLNDFYFRKIHTPKISLIFKKAFEDFQKIDRMSVDLLNLSLYRIKYFYVFKPFRFLYKKYPLKINDPLNNQHKTYYNPFLKERLELSFDEIIDTIHKEILTKIEIIYNFFKAH